MSNPSHSIVCVSVMAQTWRSLPVGSLQKRFQDLQQRSAAHHRTRGITGLLICGGGYFLEWLEGDEMALQASVMRRQQEDHHAELRVVHSGASDRRFAHWSLYVLNRPDAQDSVGRQIQWLLSCESQRLQRWSPGRMVRSVIKPPLLFRAGQRARRVALFGSSSLWISSFLAHLSAHWERPVVRTRVLHGEGLLSESVLEYLDVDHPSLGPLRWVNYASTLLDGELMPLVVERLSMGVLFQTERDTNSLLAFNASCLRHLVHQDHRTPLIAVVARASLEHMPAVLQAFDKQGRSLEVVRASLGGNTALWQALREHLHHDLLARPPEPDSVLAEDAKPQRKPPSNSPAVPPPTTQPTAMGASDFSVPSQGATACEVDSAWLSGLLEMGGVEAVSWRVYALAQAPGTDTGARCVALRNPQNTSPVDWSAILQTQEEAWAGLTCQADSEPLDQMLVRWAERLILSCRWPAESGGVLSVITRSGWVNEMLLRTALRDQLALLSPPTQAML